MKALVAKYGGLIKIYINEYRVHPMSIFFKLVGLPVQMLMYLFLWSYISRTSAVDFEYMMLYYLLSGMLGLSYPFLSIAMEIQTDVVEGGISNALVRPYFYIMPYICKYFAWMSIYSLVYIPVLLYLLFLKNIAFITIIFFAISGFLGMLIEFMTWFMIGMLAFYFEKIKGIVRIVAAVKAIVSGSLIPLHIMPESMQNITSLFPFQYYIYIPVNNLLQNASVGEHLSSLLYGCLWFVFLNCTTYILWLHGKKRLQVGLS